MMQQSSTGPLDGIKVLGLTRARAGPTCTRQLADLGAEVIEISDPSDSFGDQAFGGSDGCNLNRNKRSIALDLTATENLEVFFEMVRGSDVLVESFRPAVKHRLGIDPASLMKLNPRLVYASLSGFGQDGPYSDRPAVDQVIQGMSGLMSVTGPPGSGPWRAGIALFDVATGQMLAQGVIAALLARERTGQGQWVHTSLLETAISMMDFQAMRWLVDGVVPGQSGNTHPTLPLIGGTTLRTRDGFVNLAAMGGTEKLLAAIGDMAPASSLSSEASESAQEGTVEGRVAEVFKTRTTAEWIERIATVVPCGPVLRMDEVFSDPQVEHLRMTRRVKADGDQSVEVLRIPLNFSKTRPSVRRGPFRRGEHTAEVLAEFGREAPAWHAGPGSRSVRHQDQGDRPR